MTPGPVRDDDVLAPAAARAAREEWHTANADVFATSMTRRSAVAPAAAREILETGERAASRIAASRRDSCRPSRVACLARPNGAPCSLHDGRHCAFAGARSRTGPGHRDGT
ncbi:hypothetical protein GPZ74_30750 [Burkholderia pseudomallei]|nr:hypothetical protein [Burkholderia pseudomallei]MVZ88288.1 hypothetical protein [Burkholderia pseudomallei]MWA17691.1 hypothetical protein [Burkholderia pseudomallei]MWA28059.1 hypothetical protein [Burkholderia pseudomallei]